MSLVLIALAVPVLFYAAYIFCTKPWAGFTMTVIFNYAIMGADRYLKFPFPISVAVEAVVLALVIVLFANRQKFHEEDKIPKSLLGIYGIFTLYCTLEIINDTCNLGLDLVAWFKDVRLYGYDPIFCILAFSMAICCKKDIHKFLYVVGCILILASAKCFVQKTFGFDAAESSWLFVEGYARTHVINAGTLIRYFSFFSDAANFGSHCAMFACVFGVLCVFQFYTNRKQSIFYGIVAACCIYGMLMSGTRASMYVLFGTLTAYVVLSRNAKMFGYSILGLFFLIGMLMFTDRGNSIQAVRRMRSAFNLEENASVQVRDHNKDAISKYMDEAPFGLGLGRERSNVPTYNRYRIVIETPPDSSLVYFWVHIGIVGLGLFCFVSFIILLNCTYKVWFKIEDKELRTICALFTAAAAGWFEAGYANQVYFQYPNTFIIFGLQTIVFMGPFLDKKIKAENRPKELDDLDVQDVELIND